MTMSLEDKITANWIQTKKLIKSGRFTKSVLKDVLQAFRVEGSKAVYNKQMCLAVDPATNEEKAVPGFRLQYPLPNRESAEMLNLIMSGKKSDLPFPVSMKVSKSGSGYCVDVVADGDVYEAVMKNPRYNIGVDLEKFVRYALFRNLCQKIAAAQIYSVQPENDRKNTRQVGVTKVQTDLEALSGVILPYEPEISGFMKDSLTVLDFNKVIVAHSGSQAEWNNFSRRLSSANAARPAAKKEGESSPSKRKPG